MKKSYDNNRISLSRRIFLYLLIVTFFSVFFHGIFWVQNKYKSFQKDVDILKQNYLETKRLELKDKILQIKDYTQWVRYFPLHPLSQTLKEQLSQLNLTSFKYKTTTEGRFNTLSREITDTLRNSRIPVYVMNLKGKIVFTYNPLSENKNYKVETVVGNILCQLKNNNSGDTVTIFHYKASGPTDSTLAVVACFNKKLVPGFNVISIVTSEDFESILQIHILDSVSRLRYFENEYVFINTLDGKALITNGKCNKSPVDIRLSHNTTWIKIFKVQQTAVNHSEGVFHTYMWRKLMASDSSLKTSYFSYIPNWKWIIGMGYYQNDVMLL
jgi:hypothetical protein